MLFIRLLSMDLRHQCLNWNAFVLCKSCFQLFGVSESSVSPCAVNHRHVRLVFIDVRSKPQHNSQNIPSKP